ncbi:MAG: inositol monophosphatase [Leptospiraceae bacterium]|nr:inositol monophosphatase [Leptospiraceae bacterium]
MQELEKRIQTITAAMEQCSDLLRKLQHGDLRVSSKSNPRDLVTRADRESEEILINCIQSQFPEDSILAEESGSLPAGPGPAQDMGGPVPSPVEDAAEKGNSNPSQYRWVLDPLDGTVNYTHGSPQYAVSAGIMRGDECLAGAILHPGTGDLYTAIQGRGAFKNGKPIYVSKREPMDQCLVVTGFPYSRQEFLDVLLTGIKLTLQNARGLRRTGACCVDLTYLAEGIFDAHYEFFLKPWDTAAATCIVREAGGVLTSLAGHSYVPGMPLLLATNGKIHEQFIQVLKPLQEIMPGEKL